MTDFAASGQAAALYVPAPRAEAPAATPSATRPRPRRAAVRQPVRLGLLLAAGYLALLAVAAIAPGWLAPGDPYAANARDAFLPPSALHWLGADENGRDLLVRLVHGARTSLMIGVVATIIGLAGGVSLGLAAGLGHRWLDGVLMRGVDVLLAFPDILLALLIITFWGDGIANAIIAIGVASIPRYARVVRAQSLKVRNALFVEAAVTLGLSRAAIVWRHILPNSIKPVLLLAVIGIGGKISAGAALSFLGFGAPPPAAEWGAMLAVGRNFLGNAPWLVAAPAVAITLTVISITALGRALMRRAEGVRA